MLMLKRKCEESLKIITDSGETITILVTEAKGGIASLGIQAPDSFKIIRQELELNPIS